MAQIEGQLLLSGIAPQPMRVFHASGIDKLVEIREAVK
jgi:anti-anti-sigma regulatory factor